MMSVEMARAVVARTTIVCCVRWDTARSAGSDTAPVHLYAVQLIDLGDDDAIQKHLKCFTDRLGPFLYQNWVKSWWGMGENAFGIAKSKFWRKFWRRLDRGLWPAPEKLQNCSDFEIASYALLVDGFIFLRFYWAGCECYLNFESHAPKIPTAWPKVDKLCRS